ncbi:MAG TPA: phage holin family protein [Burkholderiales bacterium]|nr:phage holin family protein [Burkholderiales bacterium]
MSEPVSGEAGAGIVQSLRNLAATLVAILRTRFELVATELEEERIRLLQLLFWAAGALFVFGVGILLVVFLLVAVFWDSYRIIAIVTLAIIFLGAGVGMAFVVRRLMLARPKLFSSSLDELAKDRDHLTPR